MAPDNDSFSFREASGVGDEPRPRRGRSSMWRRMSVPVGAEGAAAKMSVGAARNTRLEDCKTALSAAEKETLAHLEQSLETAKAALDDATWSELDVGIRKAWDTLQRRANEQLESLSEAEASSAKEQLKDQAGVYEMKLEHVRKAGSVRLENQEASLEASFHKKMEDKIHELTDGSDNAVVRTQKQLHDLTEAMKELKLKHTGTEEALGMAQKAMKTSEARADAAEAALSSLEAEVVAVRGLLSDASLVELGVREGVSARGEKGLEDRVRLLVNECTKRGGERDDARKELEATCAHPQPHLLRRNRAWLPPRQPAPRRIEQRRRRSYTARPCRRRRTRREPAVARGPLSMRSLSCRISRSLRGWGSSVRRGAWSPRTSRSLDCVLVRTSMTAVSRSQCNVSDLSVTKLRPRVRACCRRRRHTDDRANEALSGHAPPSRGHGRPNSGGQGAHVPRIESGARRGSL